MTGSPLNHITHRQWRTLDPNTIARMAGLKPATVRQFQKLHNKPKGPRSPGSGRPVTINVDEINWALSNCRNARILGCTAQRIGQIRRELGRPAYVKTKEEDFC